MKNKLVCLLAAALVVLISSCKKSVEPRSAMVMDTVCSVNAFDDGTQKLYDSLFSRLYQIDADFSTGKADSQIALINKAAGDHPVAVSADVLYVIKVALAFAKKTDGAFDPAIGPLVDLWGINTDHAQVPEPSAIKALLPFVDWKLIQVTAGSSFAPATEIPEGVKNPAGSVFLPEKQMKLDLGGIVKGFAADELVFILKKNHVSRAILDLGGNIYMFGKKKDGEKWHVGIKDPENPAGPPAIILSLGNSTIVTSGVYERFFIQDNKRYHHMIDPKTGYPAESGLDSTTVISESSILADALSTSIFVLGAEKGLQLVEGLSSMAVPDSASETVSDGMGMWLYSGAEDDSLAKRFRTTASGLPYIHTMPDLRAGVAAVFITPDKNVIASKSLEGYLNSNNEKWGKPVFK
ncbi:MAG: FAD:protein FMN transferase [Treponema sp.]|jgi:thiamine biosynthesis lipoprotein|nr:FAD:protein FMN transferase [Treponema sp.]